MNSKKLIIYNLPVLYHILKELDLKMNFDSFLIENENSLKDKIKNLNNYLILTSKKIQNIDNQLVTNEIPINIFKLLEKINIKFLKLQFNSQSKVKINNYIIDLNAREMFSNTNKLKLTEKEVRTVIYLSMSNTPVSINELQNKVWGYQLDMETHTVETHIYRLRKKILNIFKDGDFIINKKNGYQLNKKLN